MTPGNKNLQAMIGVIEKVPDELWDMGRFRIKTDCGTDGCALGHYTLALPDADLKWSDPRPPAYVFFTLNSNRDLEDDDAVEAHFGITDDQRIFLFYPDDNLSRAEVIANIREVIAENEAGKKKEVK